MNKNKDNTDKQLQLRNRPHPVIIIGWLTEEQRDNEIVLNE